ncbi:MAG: cation diffusion facilitator family transporter [Bacteroidales bacterium]
MGHNHGHNHNHEHGDTKNIAVAFILNSFFVIVEIIGGYLTNSIAIMSDALHDFGDSLSLGIAWGLQKKAKKGRDNKYSYGYKRFSLLGSVFLSGVLSVSSVYVLIEAFKRLSAPEVVDAKGMLWLAIFGIIINGSAAFRLKKGTSLNERAVFLHIMEDVLGWVAVLIVSITMMFVNLPILDPLLSIAISIWVLSNVYKNIRETFKILLQAIPDSVDTEALENEIKQIPEVESIHDLHIWSLDGESHIMTLHIVTESKDKRALKSQVIAISEKYHIVHVTIEMESSKYDCLHSCD